MLSRVIRKRDDQSEHRNHTGFSAEGPGVRASTRIFASKAVDAAAGICVLALGAAVFYRVRELLAALILFSAVFGVVIIAVLILWLVEQAAHEGAIRLGTHMAHFPARHIFAPARARANHIHSRPHSDKTSCAVGAPPCMKIESARFGVVNRLISVGVEVIFIAEGLIRMWPTSVVVFHW
jgi:hypothetical protein